jgi:hypothetical protein
MIRSGLSVYLAFATLAGPWLCCCTAARATASLLHSVPQTTAPREDDRPACCRHHSARRHQQTRTEQPQRESRGKPGCPCGQDPGRTVVALDTESARQLQPAPAAPNPNDVLSLTADLHALPANGMAPVPRERCAPPFVSTSDLLRAMHLLRC